MGLLWILSLTLAEWIYTTFKKEKQTNIPEEDAAINSEIEDIKKNREH